MLRIIYCLHIKPIFIIHSYKRACNSAARMFRLHRESRVCKSPHALSSAVLGAQIAQKYSNVLKIPRSEVQSLLWALSGSIAHKYSIVLLLRGSEVQSFVFPPVFTAPIYIYNKQELSSSGRTLPFHGNNGSSILPGFSCVKAGSNGRALVLKTKFSRFDSYRLLSFINKSQYKN